MTPEFETTRHPQPEYSCGRQTKPVIVNEAAPETAIAAVCREPARLRRCFERVRGRVEARQVGLCLADAGEQAQHQR